MAGPAIIKICAPERMDPAADIIAFRTVGEEMQSRSWNKRIILINDLQISKIRRSAEAFGGETAAAHLGRSDATGEVDDLAAELEHGCVLA